MSLVASFLSVWLTVAAAVDRVNVLCSGGRTSFSSRTRARFVGVGLLWFALPVYLNFSILIDVDTEGYFGPICMELHGYHDMMQVYCRCPLCIRLTTVFLNPLESRGNYSAASNNMKLVHWPLMGGLLHLV